MRGGSEEIGAHVPAIGGGVGERSGINGITRTRADIPKIAIGRYRVVSLPSTMVQHLRVTYNDIHNLIRQRTPEIARAFNPDLLIAIGAFPWAADAPVLSIGPLIS
jgi:hypothetical protein